jgi:DNA-binding NarL/FixJ family response regulator
LAAVAPLLLTDSDEKEIPVASHGAAPHSREHRVEKSQGASAVPSEAPRKPRLLLADDHAIFVEGLFRLLEPDFEIVGLVQDGRAMVTDTINLKPDVVLSDITMPLLNGIEALRQLRKVGSEARIIFLTMHAEPAYAAECLEAGAKGYLVKESASSELLVAIREVMEGRTYVASQVADTTERLIQEQQLRRERTAHSLTPRQREVLQLVAEGRSAKEIAAILQVSHRTVEFHKQSIMKEIGMHTTAELTQFAIETRVLAP